VEANVCSSCSFFDFGEKLNEAKKSAITLMVAGMIVMLVCLGKWNYIVKPTEKNLIFLHQK